MKFITFLRIILILYLCITNMGCELSKPKNIPVDSTNLMDTNERNEKKISVEEVREIARTTGNEVRVPVPEIKEVIKEKTPEKSKKVLTKKYAIMTFDSIVHHLSDIYEGDVFKHKFHFTNTGLAPLSIHSVNPSCGCTMPSFPFLDIAPGLGGEILLTYNSVNKKGPQIAEISVKANTYPETLILQMRFDVLPDSAKKLTVKTDTLSN